MRSPKCVSSHPHPNIISSNVSPSSLSTAASTASLSSPSSMSSSSPSDEVMIPMIHHPRNNQKRHHHHHPRRIFYWISCILFMILMCGLCLLFWQRTIRVAAPISSSSWTTTTNKTIDNNPTPTKQPGAFFLLPTTIPEEEKVEEKTAIPSTVEPSATASSITKDDKPTGSNDEEEDHENNNDDDVDNNSNNNHTPIMKEQQQPQPMTTMSNLTLAMVLTNKQLKKQLRSDWPVIYQKIPNLHSQQQQSSSSICFVHVGKSAGSTVSCLLGFLHGRCQNKSDGYQFIIPPLIHSPVTQAVTHMIHNDYNDCIGKKKIKNNSNKDNNDDNDDDDDNYDDDDYGTVTRPYEFQYYMFAIRDPVQRMISWFNYESPRNTKKSYRHWDKVKALYLDCHFDTMNELGEYIGTDDRNITDALAMIDNPHDDDDDDEEEDDDKPHDPNMERPPICRKRAILAVTGRKRYVFHNYYNYGYYYHQVAKYSERKKKDSEFWKSNKVLALRSEHLQDDWESIEQGILGDKKMQYHHDNNASSSFSTTNKSPKRDDRDQYLSPIAMENLCFWLCWEIQIYKKIIVNAVNLNDNDKQTSMQELAKSCPIQAASETSCYDDVALFENKKKTSNKTRNEKDDKKKTKNDKLKETKGL